MCAVRSSSLILRTREGLRKLGKFAQHDGMMTSLRTLWSAQRQFDLHLYVFSYSRTGAAAGSAARSGTGATARPVTKERVNGSGASGGGGSPFPTLNQCQFVYMGEE